MIQTKVDLCTAVGKVDDDDDEKQIWIKKKQYKIIYNVY